jgi:hypothetical protein
MTAIGHFSVQSETRWNPSIVTFFMELSSGGDQGPLEKRHLVRLWHDRNMHTQHPRFHQTIVPNERGQLRFAETDDDHLEEHVVQETTYPMSRADLRKRIATFQLERWNLADTLWHLQIANQKQPSSSLSNTTTNENETTTTSDGTKTMLLFRGHHALADGASMGAALSDLFDEGDELRESIRFMVHKMRKKWRARNILQRIWNTWIRFVRFIIGSVRAIFYQGFLFWHTYVSDPDPWAQIKAVSSTVVTSKTSSTDTTTGAAAARTVSWSPVASVEQVKWIAERLNEKQPEQPRAKITVNDVFVSCVTAALARQLEWHRKRLHHRVIVSETTPSPSLPQQPYIHVAMPVHLKGGVVLPDESVGNNLGAVVARVPGESDSTDSVSRLRSTSRALYSIMKQTPAAFLSHLLAKSLSYASAVIPITWTSRLYELSNAKSICVISNNRGSPVPLHMDSRRVESLYGFVPLPPGIPVGVVIMSYAGEMYLTVTAEPWAIPDPDQFTAWILEEYLSLLDAAAATATATTSTTRSKRNE